MRLLLSSGVLLALLLVAADPVESQSSWWNFPKEAAQGTKAMYTAYRDMKDSNWRNSDLYFHARGNRDAARYGPGGRWAAERISNLREIVDQRIKGDSRADSLRDQAANRWGRSGGDPNKYRPRGLPSKY